MKKAPETITVRFQAFHREHPEVYGSLVRLAREGRKAGYERLSMAMLWEVLRWQRLLRDKPAGEDYVLNDHYTSRYARLIMDREPRLAGVFEIRRLRSE